MSQFVVLDSGPLGLLTHPQRNAEVVTISEWLSRSLISGRRMIVPAIVYYELKRELLRAGKTVSASRLDTFASATAGRYLYLSLISRALSAIVERVETTRAEGDP